jgi:Ulp1 family protease
VSSLLRSQESKCFILALDSLGWDATASMDIVERYLLAFINRTRPADDQLMDLNTHISKKTVAVPSQVNGFDCGTCRWSC